MGSAITSSRGQSTLQRGQIAHWQVPSQSCPGLKQVEQALSRLLHYLYQRVLSLTGLSFGSRDERVGRSGLGICSSQPRRDGRALLASPPALSSTDRDNSRLPSFFWRQSLLQTELKDCRKHQFGRELMLQMDHHRLTRGEHSAKVIRHSRIPVMAFYVKWAQHSIHTLLHPS